MARRSQPVAPGGGTSAGQPAGIAPVTPLPPGPRDQQGQALQVGGHREEVERA